MSSFNTLYSCDVIQNGDDASPAGPFLTINAAITYMKNNFSAYLASGVHGTINIGPGTWVETLSLTTTDASNFIDFVGAGIDDTIIENATNGFIDIDVTTAENHFSNMTISYTGASTVGNYAIYAGINNGVIFNNCQINSTQQCFNLIDYPAVISNCSLVSTASNADSIVYQLNGSLINCELIASSLGSGGYAVGAFNSGLPTMEYCTIILNNAVETNGLGGGAEAFVSYCSFNIGGSLNCTLSSYDNLWVKSTCVSGPILYLLGGGYVSNSFFQNTSSSQSSVNFNSGNGTITGSTFLQLNNSQNVCTGLGSSSKIFETVLQNNGSGGYSIAAGTVGNTLTVGNIVSNCPIDPGFTLTDAGLSGMNIGAAKGYSQKRWFSLNCSAGNYYGNGCGTSSSGALSSGNNTTNGPSTTLSSTSATTYIATASALADVRFGNTPTLFAKFQLNQTTNIGFWIGLFNGTVPDSVTLSSDCAALRFYPASDTDWQFVTNNAGTQNLTSSGHVPDTNVHTLKVTLDYANSRAIFQLDSNAVKSVTTDLPSAGSDLGFAISITSTNGSAQTVNFFDAWCEYNA